MENQWVRVFINDTKCMYLTKQLADRKTTLGNFLKVRQIDELRCKFYINKYAAGFKLLSLKIFDY